MTDVVLILIFVFLLSVVFAISFIAYMQQHLINTLNRRLTFLLARMYDSLNEYASMSVAQVDEKAAELDHVIKLNEEYKESQFDPFELLENEQDIT
jgi:predicted Holliday junction resolvase-like endonuclease